MAWSDSGSFLDTEETYKKAFALDWSRALRSHGLANYILKNDDGESEDDDDEEDDSGDEDQDAAAEIAEVRGLSDRASPLMTL